MRVIVSVQLLQFMLLVWSMLFLMACSDNAHQEQFMASNTGSKGVVIRTAEVTAVSQDEPQFPAAAQSATSTHHILSIEPVAALGNVLVIGSGSKAGRTLYSLSYETFGVSLCYEYCLDLWQPLIVKPSDNLTLADDMLGSVGHTVRHDGRWQLTYNNKPLYSYRADAHQGDMLGQGVGGVWSVAVEREPLVRLADVDSNRRFLVASNQDRSELKVYRRASDGYGVSSCYHECAIMWPPVLVDDEQDVTLASGIFGQTGLIVRQDGTLQVTFDGHPLYFSGSELDSGAVANNDEARDEWYLVYPTAKAVTMSMSSDEGGILVSGYGQRVGFTLYTFKDDEPGFSQCYEDCAAAWPPFLVPDLNFVQLDERLSGQLGVLERSDGSLQLTYNEQALYFYISDQKPGDILGQALGGGAWQVAKELPDFTVNTMQIDGFGDVLVAGSGDKAGFALYTFDHDRDGHSHCYNECLDDWQPLTVDADKQIVLPTALQGVISSAIRDDGRVQLAYLGQPLYLYLGDHSSGDTQGQGLHELWFLASFFCGSDRLAHDSGVSALATCSAL